MIERLFLILALVVGLFLIIKFLKYRQLKKVKHISHELINNKTDIPQIIYFWSPQCQQCQSMQKPILDDISNKFNYPIRNINILKEASIAEKWNIRTVPSTYILDGIGNIEFINNGFKTEKEIMAQLEKL